MSTKDTHRERRRSVAVRHSRERATKSTPFRFFATKATKRERDIRATERASSYTLTFLVRFCFPAEILFADRRNSYARKKERKKERTMRYILLSFFRVVVYIVLMNYVKSVVSASVSLGQFYRYLVRIHHGTQNDAEIQIPFNTTTKKKVKRNERRAKRALL